MSDPDRTLILAHNSAYRKGKKGTNEKSVIPATPLDGTPALRSHGRGPRVEPDLVPELGRNGQGLPPDLNPDGRHVKLLDLMLSRQEGVIGVSGMIGTSLKDIRLMLAHYREAGNKVTKVTKYWSESYAMPKNLERRILRLQHGNRKMLPREVLIERNRLNKAVSIFVSEAVNVFLEKVQDKLGIVREQIGFFGYLGQTLRYDPEPVRMHFRSDWIDKSFWVSGIDTLGDPAEIRDSIVLPVVSKMRESDMTRRAGGRGAPLSGFDDYVRFWSAHTSRVILNIGGIANFSFVRAGSALQDLLSFDTGPGNMVMDFVVRRLTRRRRNQLEYDVDGKMARRGKVIKPLLAEAMSHPYFRRRPPLTTGAETFGRHWVNKVFFQRKYAQCKPEDLVATALEFTVRSIVWGLRFVTSPINEFIVYGGGSLNAYLMERLAEAVIAECLKRGWPQPKFMRIEEADRESNIGPEDKETATVGLIAYKRLKGHVTSTPATGAGPTLQGGIWS